MTAYHLPLSSHQDAYVHMVFQSFLIYPIHCIDPHSNSVVLLSAPTF